MSSMSSSTCTQTLAVYPESPTLSCLTSLATSSTTREPRPRRLWASPQAPILVHLLTWLQDCNWPVSWSVERFLATIDEPLVDPIRSVLRSNDDMWKYWIIQRLVQNEVMESAIETLHLDAPPRT